MKKILLLMLPVLLLFTGCEKTEEVQPDTKFEAVARLYTEMLWRPLTESDDNTLALCSDTVQEKIKTTSETAQTLLRRLDYLTKEEVSELLGPLDEYYERKKNDWLGQQELAIAHGEEGLGIDEYKPIQVLTQETYETITDKNGTRVVLEDGNGVSFKPPVQYSENYTCELKAFENGIYKYNIKLEEDSEFDLYLDVKDGIVERMQEQTDNKF